MTDVLTPSQRCTFCGGVLVPPTVVVGDTPPAGADYACWKCGRPYAWVGDPPKLALLGSDGDAGRTLFRSAESNFEVMFLSTPHVQEEHAPGSQTTTFFTHANAATLFQVRVAPATPHFGSAVELLHRTLNALALTMTQPVLTRVRNLEHRGLPALRFSFVSAARRGEGLLVLSRATLFTVVAIDHSVVGLERNRFVESFSVLDNGA